MQRSQQKDDDETKQMLLKSSSSFYSLFIRLVTADYSIRKQSRDTF